MIDGNTRLCGLIGRPVEHTLSPAIHNKLAADLGQNLVYVPLLTDSDIGTAVSGAYALNILGLNVTVPYKNDVIPYLKDIDPLAAKIGAVNTLVRIDGGYKGYNTDILGLKRALDCENISLSGKTIVIIGAGGAARAVSYLCASEGASRIYILNRTSDKALELKKDVCAVFPDIHVTAGALSTAGEIPEDDIIALQCTSVGLFPHVNESPVSGSIFFRKICFAFDLIYRPDETMFLGEVRRAGGRTSNGLKMLLYQGIASYELWNDVSVDEAEASKIYTILRELVRGQ